MLLVHQNTGKENRYGKTFLLHLSAHWGDLIEQMKKNLSYTLEDLFSKYSRGSEFAKASTVIEIDEVCGQKWKLKRPEFRDINA